MTASIRATAGPALIALLTAALLWACGASSAPTVSPSQSARPSAVSPSASSRPVATTDATSSAGPSSPAAPTVNPSGGSSSTESPSASGSLPPLPHAILDINALGHYRGIVSSAKWAPAGPASVRSFGSGIPEAASLRRLSARLGSILEISLERLSMRSISAFAAPIDEFTGQISTSKPFQRVRYTSVRVRSGPEVSFYAPPAGEWIMYAVIGFPDGSGSGTYFWRILVK